MDSTQSPFGSAGARLHKQQANATLIAVALLGCFSGLLHLLTRSAFRSGTLFVSGYWASFYQMSYADGFRRRALVGSAFRLFEPGGASVTTMNILAGLVLLLLLTIFVLRFVREAGKVDPWSSVFLAAFFLSALIGIYFEVLGDLLQLSLLLFLCSFWSAITQVPGGIYRVALLIVVAIPCFLIHEASIFFIAPCLPFVITPSPRMKHFLLTVVTLLVFLTWSSQWSDVHPQMTYHLNLLHGFKRIDTKETLGTPTFRELMRQQYLLHFAGLHGKLNFFSKVLKVLALVIGGWIAIANILPKKALERALYIYAALMFFSIPFWILAADWGRFTSYNILLAIVLSSWNSEFAEAAEYLPDTIRSLARRLVGMSGFTLIRITALVALLGSEFEGSRIYGMDLRHLLSVMFIGAFGVAQMAGLLGNAVSNLETPKAEEVLPPR